jgi:hypothetical protein
MDARDGHSHPLKEWTAVLDAKLIGKTMHARLTS